MSSRGDSTGPVVNPMVQELLGAGGNVLMIGGYAGPAAEGRLRLYADLSLGKYIEIPMEDVVRIVQDPKQPEEPCMVFFKSTAELTYVQKASIRADQALTMAASRCACGGECGRGAAARQIDGGGGGPTVSICDWACQERLLFCLDTDSRWQQFWCVVEYGLCRLGCTIGPVIV